MLEVLTDVAVNGESVVEAADLLLQADPRSPEYASNLAEGLTAIAGGLAVGLAAFGTGYAQRGIGAAAVGAVAEDSDNLVSGLIFTVIPETLIIIAFITIFLL